MENKILDILERLETKANGIEKDIKELKQGQERIEKKLESVHEQVERTAEDVTGIKKDLTNIEMITAKNWGDLVTLKAVSRL